MKKIAVLFFVFVFSLVLLSEVNAISAWSRKYGTDCSMCHWKQNKLNSTGKDFLRRGHRLAGEDSKTKDGAWANLSDYVSVTQKIRAQYENTASNRPGFYVEALSLYAGGPLDKTYSFFYEQYLHENNKSGADREKLAEAYLMGTFGDDKDYNTFRIGQVSPSMLHLAGTGGRLPISRPYVLESASFAANNPYAPRARQYGIEFAANRGDMFGALGIVNGTGHKNINPAGDTNGAKDIYLTVEKAFDDNGSSIGLYGYNGVWSLNPTDAAALGIATTYLSTSETNFTQLGLIGNYTNSIVSFVGGALVGQNSPVGGTSISNLGYYVEADLAIAEKAALFGRFDNWDGNTNISNDETRQVAAGLSVEPMKAGRIALEGLVTQTIGSAPTTKIVSEFQYMY
ncbi:hypothetical protein HZC34_01475 [Candidatus Saganbacteria bacterium]|nr:hypothetical protein [Candidatus Saganbacteria bacterium]